jgi:hypothetical protein
MAGTPIPTLFFGGRDTFASVLQTNAGFQDNGVNYIPSLLTNPVAPGGASGECIFRNAYFTLTHSMDAEVRVTPIVDFVPLNGVGGQPDERIVITLADLTATGRETDRYEMGLSLPFPLTGTERFRNALRGAWFQLLFEAINGLAAGDLIFEQVELEYEIVRESVVAEAP